MPTLTIDNTVTVVNSSIGLTIAPALQTPTLGLITVAGPQGPQGIPGVATGGSAAGVSSINLLTGALGLTGAGIVTVSNNGQTITISGNASAGGVTQGQLDALSGYTLVNLQSTGQQVWTFNRNDSINLSGNLYQTGSTLSSQILTISGLIPNVNGFISTGSADLRYYPLVGNPSGFIVTGQTGQFYPASNPNQHVTSGNLTNTGATIWNALLATSGNLSSTGSNLQGQINTLTSNLTSTGATAWNALLTTSGNLASTGSNLQGQVNTLTANLSSTGATVWNALINTSGNLQTTGATLVARDASMSGQLDLRLIATGLTLGTNLTATGATIWGALLTTSGNLQTTGANLSAVKVTGSTVVNSPNFVGAGNTTVYISGSTVYVSGATAGGAGVTDVNGLQNSVTIGATGGISVRVIGQTVFVSGDQSISGALTATGATIWNALITTSGNLASTGSNLQSQINTLTTNLTSTGSTIWNALLTTSGNLSSTGGNLQSQVNTLTTNLTATGATIWNALLTTSGNLASTGSNLQGQVNTLTTNLTSTGAKIWDALILTSGNLVITGLAIGSVSGAIATKFANTGAILWQRDLDISGALATQIAGGGSVVKITGSSAIPTADITGMGTVTVSISGGIVIVSGSTTAGGGVPSVNGITSAVTIAGTGNLSAVTIGNNVIISGSRLTSDRQVIFDNQGALSGVNTFTWNNASGTLAIGNPTIFVGNPLAVAGSGTSYIQINLQNQSSGLSAQADYVLTADIGTDTNNFVDLGINNTKFADTGYQLYKPLDGFLYNRGGDMFLGTATTGNVVGVHVGGIQSGNLVAYFNTSGLTLTTGMDFRVGGTAISSSITSTGSTIWNALLATSGNLSSTGSNLQGQINTLTTNLTATGATIWNALITTSGNLASTGSTLNTKIDALSGYVTRAPTPLCFTNGAQVTWASMPTKENFFATGQGYITFMDLSAFTGVSLVINKMNIAGTSSGALYLSYLDAFSTTASSYKNLDTNGMRTNIGGTSTIANSGFQPIVNAARSGVYIALLGASGNNTASPNFGMITAFFK